MITCYAFTRKYHQIKHASSRSRDRYGFEASPAIIQRIIAAIRDGSAETLSSERLVYRVDCSSFRPDLKGVSVIVGYDEFRKNIRTFLPPDWTVEKAEAHDRAKLEAATVTIPSEGSISTSSDKKRPGAGERLRIGHQTAAEEAVERLAPSIEYLANYVALDNQALKCERTRLKSYRATVLIPALEEIKQIDHDWQKCAGNIIQARLFRCNLEIKEINLALTAPRPEVNTR